MPPAMRAKPSTRSRSGRSAGMISIITPPRAKYDVDHRAVNRFAAHTVPLAQGARDQRIEQREHDLVVPDQLVAGAPVLGRATDHVELGPVMALHIEVDRGEPRHGRAGVAAER